MDSCSVSLRTQKNYRAARNTRFAENAGVPKPPLAVLPTTSQEFPHCRRLAILPTMPEFRQPARQAL
jgi:hypothetical protein